VTGSPMREVLDKHAASIEASSVLDELNLEKEKYILLSAHREENVDLEEHFHSLMDAVNTVVDKYMMPIIFSTHPRSKLRIEERGFKFHEPVRSLPPFGYLDYVKLQKNAWCVLSDSGTLSEESAILGFPAVLIRTSTERPEAVDAGTVVVGGISSETILPAIELARGGTEKQAPIDYEPTDVSEKVVRIIQSHTAIINDRVWRKL